MVKIFFPKDSHTASKKSLLLCGHKTQGKPFPITPTSPNRTLKYENASYIAISVLDSGNLGKNVNQM
jgi:hypothetical protein